MKWGSPLLAAALFGCGSPGATACAALPLTAYAWGDSLTAGGAWFPGMPEAWTMFDHAVGGAEWHDRIGVRCRDDISAGTRGDIAVLFGGTNDVAQQDWDVDATMSEVTLTVTAALEAGFAVVVVMPPPLYRTDTGAERVVAEMTEFRDALFAEFLPQTDVVLADIYTVFKADADPLSLYEPDEGESDGVHPGPSGQALETTVITAAAVEALEIAHA